MKKLRKSCRSEYNRGLAERREHPLHTGDYRLRQCEGYFGRPQDLMADLRACPSRKEFREYCFVNYVKEELLGAPQYLAYRIGFDVLPGIEALVGDGVPEFHVRQKLKLVETQCLEIVATLQRISDGYQLWGIEEELETIRRGIRTDLEYACRSVLDIIDAARDLLRLAGPCPPSTIRPTKLQDARV